MGHVPKKRRFLCSDTNEARVITSLGTSSKLRDTFMSSWEASTADKGGVLMKDCDRGLFKFDLSS